jgi:hypothetical protein
MEPEWIADLGEPRRRDPDALPPSNIFEYVMHMIWVGVSALWQGNVLFAIKAGALTGKCIAEFFCTSSLCTDSNTVNP